MRKCWRCSIEYNDSSRNSFCVCGATMDDVRINLTGTRDGFGIRNAFYSPHAKKYIDNWKDWRRAGYEDPLHDSNIENDVKEMTKEKIRKIKFYKSRGEKPDGKTGISGK